MAGPFWSLPESELGRQLGGTGAGLTSAEAERRLRRAGPNTLDVRPTPSTIRLLVAQFQSPITLLLLAAAATAFALGDRTDTVIIAIIVLASGLLGFWQEHAAGDAVRRLLALVRIHATVLRDGVAREIPAEQVVPGDVVLLAAGAGIPGDGRLLEAHGLFVDEAALTGESFPAEKAPATLAEETPLAARACAVFAGTHVTSGSGRALVVRTGRATEFGRVAGRLRAHPPETAFEHGVRRFGYLLLEVTLLLTIGIFAVNVYFHRPVLEALLFALALAVGLTPQLLPAIVSVNLARGARRMAERQVVVKRLAAIEDFGSMDVLCSDKTGTLTEGRVRLEAALDVTGAASDRVLRLAAVNATFESGYANPMDEAIRARAPDLSGWEKLDEVPYDFGRRRLSVLARGEGERLLVSKGAVAGILGICQSAELPDGRIVPVATVAESIQGRCDALGRRGLRTLGVAYRTFDEERPVGPRDEAGMTFVGLLTFLDPPKPGAAEAVQALRRLGVSLKLVTGDNHLVATTIAEGVGLSAAGLVTGTELRRLSDVALVRRAATADVFAEIEPDQKERVVRALRRGGSVVGYIGDGINDAAALHAADVGISVNGAVDVAKEAAAIVLLETDLGVLGEGVREGRRTFANTLKYVFMATSANFGNMASMAGASLFLPFLPLLPTQILLMNLLTDLPEMTIATDAVDPELLEAPRRWDVPFIRRFMLTFGALSSIFDFLTFGALLLVRAAVPEFRTGWFVESVVSASTIVLVMRTRRPAFRSRPSRPLLAATVAVVALTALLPFTPLARLFGFVPLPRELLLMVAAIVFVYVLAAEVAKWLFYRRPARAPAEAHRVR
ncbi:MAG TPA: magnesium-translocating P-type ATPase [Longimicrobiales bacterium]|nr:magnesium-translocating P-type ATPase [Longimicrobiales bacterium]